jgi:hypothetical protein
VRQVRMLTVLVVVALAGCGQIAVDPKPVPPAPSTTVDYDLAIVSVDFDPALQGNRLPISNSYAVLVAIENRGVLTARNIKVNASLDSVGGDRAVLQGSQSLSELAPGAIKVVRIQPAGTLPAEFATYELTVQAQPLPTETILSNNVRGFTIRVAP